MEETAERRKASEYQANTGKGREFQPRRCVVILPPFLEATLYADLFFERSSGYAACFFRQSARCAFLPGPLGDSHLLALRVDF